MLGRSKYAQTVSGSIPFQRRLTNGGKCGVCGDAWGGPRDNEAGGKYATGILVRHYKVSVFFFFFLYQKSLLSSSPVLYYAIIFFF